MMNYIHTNLPINAIVRLLHPWSGNSQGQETFLAPSVNIYVLYINNVSRGLWCLYTSLGAQIMCRNWWTILVNKVFIANVSEHLRHLTLSLFFFKKSSQTCYHVMFQPVFTSNYKLASSVRFTYHNWFWYSLNIFRLEAINPRIIQNIQCLKDTLTVNMKIFPWALAP